MGRGGGSLTLDGGGVRALPRAGSVRGVCVRSGRRCVGVAAPCEPEPIPRPSG